MRRLTIFLLFLLLAGLLAPAHFAKAATTSYYGVQFDGSTAYVQTPLPDNFSTAFSVIVIGVFNNQPAGLVGTSKFEGAGYDSGFALSIRYGKFRFRVANASKTATIVGTTAVFGQAVMLAGVFNGTDAQIYMNGKLENSAPCNGYTPRNINITIAKALPDWTSPWYLNGKIYLVLIYNRALSDSEVQAIYNDPLNPPTDGLVLWYAPDSVDTASNVWTDKSGNGNDGQINGATYVPLRPVSESEPSKDAPVALDYATGTKQGTVIQNVSLGNDGTILFICRVNTPTKGNLLDARTGWFGAGGTGVTIRDLAGAGKYDFLIANGSAVTFVKRYVNLADKHVHVIGMTWTSTSASAIIDTNIYTATVSLSDTFTNGVIYLGSGWEGGTNSTIYLVLIYNRALNSSEIRQIYENPNDPPRDGLVLWYSPYTYDPSTGKWLNRAPIFPTIPLAEELDGVNYGATPERVSIPKLSVYNAQNNSEIPVENVSVALIENNTTISLLPTLLTLPYNSTVALNVSASGYESRNISLLTPINALSVYLQPANKTSEKETEELVTSPTETLPSPTSSYPSTGITDHGFIGYHVFTEFFGTFDVQKTVQTFFGLSPIFLIAIPLIDTIALGMATWYFTKSSIASLGAMAILMTVFYMVSAPVKLAMIGPMTGLVILLIAWIFWDFYKHHER